MKKKAILILSLVLILPLANSDASSTLLDISSWLPVIQEDSSLTEYQTYHESGRNHYRSNSPFNSMDVKYDGVVT